MRVYGTKGQNGRTLAWPLLERAVRETWGLEELPELNPVQMEEFKQQAEAEVQLQLDT